MSTKIHKNGMPSFLGRQAHSFTLFRLVDDFHPEKRATLLSGWRSGRRDLPICLNPGRAPHLPHFRAAWGRSQVRFPPSHHCEHVRFTRAYSDAQDCRLTCVRSARWRLDDSLLAASEAVLKVVSCQWTVRCSRALLAAKCSQQAPVKSRLIRRLDKHLDQSRLPGSNPQVIGVLMGQQQPDSQGAFQ